MPTNVQSHLLFVFFIGICLPSGSSANELNDLKDLQNVRCNRDTWLKIMVPYIEADAAYQLNASNPDLGRKFQEMVIELGVWKSANLGRKTDVCNLLQFAECDENNRCICAQGRAPYSFEQKEGSTICLAKRGTVCMTDAYCIEGVECENRKNDRTI
jgi:hypothetical protein